MFITVRFGDDSREIFNPDCRIVNLIIDIRNKCRIDEKQIVDLTDETGLLVRLSTAKPHEKGLEYLLPLTTYVLVEKRIIKAVQPKCSSSKDTSRTQKDLYFPLLVGVVKLLPGYCFHRTLAEKAAIMKRNKILAKSIPQSEASKDEGKANYQRKSVSISSSRKSIVGLKSTSRNFKHTFTRRSTLM